MKRKGGKINESEKKIKTEMNKRFFFGKLYYFI